MIIFALLQGLGRPKHSWSILWLWLKKAATIPAFGSKLNPCCTSSPSLPHSQAATSSKKSYPRHCLAGRIINLKSRYWRGCWIGWTGKKRLVSYQKQHISTISGQILQGLYGYTSFCDVPIALWRLCQKQLLSYLFVQKIQKWCWCWLVDSKHSHEHNILLASIP